MSFEVKVAVYLSCYSPFLTYLTSFVQDLKIPPHKHELDLCSWKKNWFHKQSVLYFRNSLMLSLCWIIGFVRIQQCLSFLSLYLQHLSSLEYSRTQLLFSEWRVLYFFLLGGDLILVSAWRQNMAVTTNSEVLFSQINLTANICANVEQNSSGTSQWVWEA